jgi:hypothetical protein
MSELTDQQIYDRLGTIKGLPTCTQWAEGFADSIREQLDGGKVLSNAQRSVCIRILEQNSREAQLQLANWKKEYNMHHKKTALQVATYYSSQAAGYYGDIVTTILSGEVPNRDAYLKMVNNKYAKRVIKEIKSKPRFGTEDHIIPNSKFIIGYGFNKSMMAESGNEEKWTPSEETENFKNRGGIIIAIDDKILSAAKGSKRYLVLPIGSVKTYWVEERYLKKRPKKTK